MTFVSHTSADSILPSLVAGIPLTLVASLFHNHGFTSENETTCGTQDAIEFSWAIIKFGCRGCIAGKLFDPTTKYHTNAHFFHGVK